jgi:Protein of unknown function (DUF1416)
MARLTGTVSRGSVPAEGAYVQLRNTGGDFQAEVRTDEDGRFTLYPIPGTWRLVSFAPRTPWVERDVEVGGDDVEIDLTLEATD